MSNMATFMRSFLGRSLGKFSQHASFRSRVNLQVWRTVASQNVLSLTSDGIQHSGTSMHSNVYPQLSLLPFSNRQPQRLCSSLVPSLYHPNSSAVIDEVNGEIAQGLTRTFAVVQLSGLQHKVTTGDLILVQTHLPPDVGERIRLEKVLLVGGDNFTLIGRPLLSLDTVRVEATVIEKTISEKKVVFKFKRRKRVSKYQERYTGLTVLRINSIEVSPKLT